VLDEEKLQH
jgi:hypothetical protein